MTQKLAEKRIYAFGAGQAEGSAALRALLGGKGANLAEMSRLGLPVPPGFTITTDMCLAYRQAGAALPEALRQDIRAAMDALESATGKGFGDVRNPLLVSVRSGARDSMPGMMDTVLNLGLNDETLEGLIAHSADPRFAADSYRRFIQMYSDVVLDVPHHDFEDALDDLKREWDKRRDTDLSAEDWMEVITAYKKLVQEETGVPFPQDPWEQLFGAIAAVFASWDNRRAITYRRLHQIPDDWGTAVTVQAMVFGNMGDDCATGVAFTRDPSTGENRFYGEYLINAQGEDVVAGIRTPQSLTRAGRESNGSTLPSMEESLPEVYIQLLDMRRKLEAHYRDMQDIEFTVERGQLYMLQTRNGKRTAQAAIRIAVEMAQEGLITRSEALDRVNPQALEQLLHPRLDPKTERIVLATGLPASPGAASGLLVFTADEAEIRAQKGESVILMRVETSPEDIHGMHAAVGIITARGGMTSHAAVVARGMGRPCVAGAAALNIDYASETVTIAGESHAKGTQVTIDGSTGQIMLGELPTLQPELSADFTTLMQWADEVRPLRIRANADTPQDARIARDFGAEGIGLCRTEHMFFEPDRIQAMREMILAENSTDREVALKRLEPMQRNDFREIFRVMAGYPVTIRLLDPPLHEFLPHGKAEIAALAHSLKVDEEDILRRVAQLQEVNPMLGHRGCRLAITWPEIYAMQARAILMAAADIHTETGETAQVEIMIPLIASKVELDVVTALIHAEAKKLANPPLYQIGTMIELPRAALTAGEIAQTAQFFSFGTNDLTQTCLGLSRDDAGRFLPAYLEGKLLPHDPFVSLDQAGTGRLIAIAAEEGRASRKDLKLGICGEHGGDPASIHFVRDLGLDYVSCSPYRVPIARLAAAQGYTTPTPQKKD